MQGLATRYIPCIEVLVTGINDPGFIKRKLGVEFIFHGLRDAFCLSRFQVAVKNIPVFGINGSAPGLVIFKVVVKHLRHFLRAAGFDGGFIIPGDIIG